MKVTGAIGTALAAAFLLLFQHSGAAPIPAGEELEQRARELHHIKSRMEGVAEALSAAARERDTLTEELARQERQIGDLTRRLRELDLQITAQRARLAELEGEKSYWGEIVAQHSEVLGELLRAAYVVGRQERLKLILNQENAAVVSRMVVYYDYLNRDRVNRIRAAEDSLAALKRIEAGITEEERRLLSLESETIAEQAKLQQSRQERGRLLARLDEDIRDRGSQLAELEQNAERMESLLVDLQRKLEEATLAGPSQESFSERRGALMWPAAGRLAERFGAPRRGSGLPWDGVVISAREGSEVRAVFPGQVVFSDWLRGFGLLLIIDHGDGYMTLYGHNQTLFKGAGEQVQAGEVVALAGRSGGRSEAGVYFAIRHQGKPVDPRKWCQAARRGKVG